MEAVGIAVQCWKICSVPKVEVSKTKYEHKEIKDETCIHGYNSGRDIIISIKNREFA